MRNRHVTPHRDGVSCRRDPRPFVPMRPGRISLIDLPIMAAALIFVRWVSTHVSSLPATLGVLAAAGVSLGLLSGYLAIRRQARRSRPMISPDDDQPFG